jgi:hypothetical protein
MPTNQPHVTRQYDEESFFETLDAPSKGDNYGDDKLYCDGYAVVRSIRQFDW